MLYLGKRDLSCGAHSGKKKRNKSLDCSCNTHTHNAGPNNGHHAQCSHILPFLTKTSHIHLLQPYLLPPPLHRPTLPPTLQGPTRVLIERKLDVRAANGRSHLRPQPHGRSEHVSRPLPLLPPPPELRRRRKSPNPKNSPPKNHRFQPPTRPLCRKQSHHRLCEMWVS